MSHNPKIRIEIPKKIAWVFSDKVRYRGAYGGRGSGKSFNFAKMTAILGVQKSTRILCARELQNSIKDSVHHEVVAAIESDPYLAARYDYGQSYIKGKNGTEYLFKGLRHNYRDIKSTSNIDICWIEEAETVSEESWRVLTPTIRAENSEIWLTWNPESEDSATHNRFILNPPESARIAKVNYTDNKWFPGVLEQERLRDYKLNPDMYSHVWEGECITRSDAQIFSDKWVVEDFDDPINVNKEQLFHGPYYGSDFGFSQDPTTIVRCYIYNNCLFISHEGGGIGVDIDRIKDIYAEIPGAENSIITADSARPETISYLKNQRLRVEGVRKWSGSVEDGVAFIRSFEKVIIHPRCKETIKEFKLYSYKIDRLSGDVTRQIIDSNNHYIDAIRYALDKIIQKKQGSFYLLSNMQF